MYQRRAFLKSALCLGLSPFLKALPQRRVADPPAIIKPARLKKGDTIGLVAPASNVWEDEEIRTSIELIRSLGFKVKEGRHLYERKAFLAGSDQQRAEDLNTMFRDDTVDGMIALRGGYGAMRILPFLDFEMIRANPKVILGFSDLTAIHHAIHRKTGLVTFHGPNATQSFSAYTLHEFKKVVMAGEVPGMIGSPPPFVAAEGVVEQENRLTTIHPGKVRGRLLGGNLSLMVKLLGTPFEPDFRGRILVLEDIRESPLSIDGMLSHLWLAGKLDQVAGIVFGKFTDCFPEVTNTMSLEQIFHERCAPLKVPVLRGLMIGHVKDKTTFPLGVEAELDADGGTLTLLESGVT